MNVLNKLALINLKKNKKRTISTLLGIILSVALIVALSFLTLSVRGLFLDQIIEETGYWHLGLNNIKDEDLEALKLNSDIENIYEVRELGYSKSEYIKNKNTPYIKVLSTDVDNYDAFRLKAVEGRLPENKQEIAISKTISYHYPDDFKIGQEISLDIGKRMFDGEQLFSYNPLILREGTLEIAESIEDVQNYTFTIVGFIDYNDAFDADNDPAYVAITTDNNKGFNNAYLAYKNPKDYEENNQMILGLEEDGSYSLDVYNYRINHDLLRYEALVFSDSTINMLYTLAGIVLFVIIFTSIYCIRNSFEIATVEKVKDIGMLKSIGATSKQIRHYVLYEAFILALIAIPLGILSGLLASFILCIVVNHLAVGFIFSGDLKIKFVVSIAIIILDIILSLLVIYFSAIKSAKKASKQTIIASLRNNDGVKLKSRNLKTPKIIEKIFGEAGVIAYKNLKRAKKKYRTTVISLTVSIFAFIAMGSFIHGMFSMVEVNYVDEGYDIAVHANDGEQIDIVNMDLVDDYTITYLDNERVFLLLCENDYLIDKKDDYSYYVQIIGLDSKTFNEYAKLNHVDAKPREAILYNKSYNIVDGKTIVKDIYNYRNGDVLNAKIGTNEDYQNISFKLAAVSSEAIRGFKNYYSSQGVLFINIEDYPELGLKADTIYLLSENPYELEKALSTYYSEYDIYSIVREQDSYKSIRMIMSIFLYGFIIVITLIGVTNIFNTISSNVELRQKEFAMLKSVGMTKKEFNKMINLETIFYSSKSLIFGIILSLIANHYINESIAEKFNFPYYIPFKEILIAMIAVFILVYLIMQYSVKKVNKQNIIETIRKENI